MPFLQTEDLPLAIHEGCALPCVGPAHMHTCCAWGQGNHATPKFEVAVGGHVAAGMAGFASAVHLVFWKPNDQGERMS
jgi:hypothetical protein